MPISSPSVESIANLSTFDLPNNNDPGIFYFDRAVTAPFKVPAGYSFVITDIFVNPSDPSTDPNPLYFVVITIDGQRSIEIASGGGLTGHIALASGLVIPEPSTPSITSGKGLHARNTTFSAGHVEIQLLGYFVRVATGLGVGAPFA